MKKITIQIFMFILIMTSCQEKEEIDSNLKANATTAEPVVSIFIGSTEGDQDGIGIEAKIKLPAHVTTDDDFIYFSDGGNHKVKKISFEGEVLTLAGSTKGYLDGPADEARFTGPWGIAKGSDGFLYVSDTNMIRKISPEGEVSTFAGTLNKGFKDGTGNQAAFNIPGGLAIATDGTIYVADMYNNAIRKIAPDGAVSTIAGGEEGYMDGNISSAKFNHPAGLALDDVGNIFVADSWNHRIRKISPQGIVSTVAGDGENLIESSPDAILVYPMDISISKEGDIFVADTRGIVVKIDGQSKVTWYAGSNEYGLVDGPASEARFNFIFGLEVDSDGNIFVSDSWQNLIRKISKE